MSPRRAPRAQSSCNARATLSSAAPWKRSILLSGLDHRCSAFLLSKNYCLYRNTHKIYCIAPTLPNKHKHIIEGSLISATITHSFPSSGCSTLNRFWILALRAAIISLGSAAAGALDWDAPSPPAPFTPLYYLVTVFFKRAIGLGFSISFSKAAE